MKRKLFRQKIVQHFETQANFAYISGIDEAIISKIYRCVRDPNKNQTQIFIQLLKTPANKLFRKWYA